MGEMGGCGDKKGERLESERRAAPREGARGAHDLRNDLGGVLREPTHVEAAAGGVPAIGGERGAEGDREEEEEKQFEQGGGEASAAVVVAVW